MHHVEEVDGTKGRKVEESHGVANPTPKGWLAARHSGTRCPGPTYKEKTIAPAVAPADHLLGPSYTQTTQTH